MLRLEGLRAGYGPVTVLQDVSLEVNAGEVVTIVGGNGAGKTTTLRAICGLIRPQGGRITVDGRDTSRLAPPEIVDLGITMIPEGRQLFPFMTVRENLMLGGFKPAARARIPERLEEVLTLFPRVRERMTQLAGSLSGGEQQMVAIARGMMANPRLLMFDEPSLGLAPLIVKQVFQIIDTVVASGTTVLIVEQNIVHTLQIATRGYVLENGRVAMSGPGPELLRDPHVKKAYLGV
ncbi:ABC transporter ATP-binding protein [Plastoroseomonas hellenica]|uniref:ABC transporter ATP-binding protein n=1 Tax=Plastoroseomonas hellenica TaxID=2687306 RepID=UPI001BABAB12|nr:ABC transporter ATP-binding protein [Plastoroseomonas hellenica]MBR0644856.1 ABC transporter ATP-binding protein [Plastoroseomonas hellenica]